MPIIHVVLFKFEDTTTDAQKRDVSERMLALKDKCIHPQTGQPYVKSYSGGQDTSPEGHQQGFTHGFVSEFQNAEDREYYLKKDPAHLDFVASLKGVLKEALVLDYEPGKF